MLPVRMCSVSLVNRWSWARRLARLGWMAMPATGLALGLGLGLALTAAATTYTVCTGGGCDYTTIQAAVNAATSGDVISVGPGIYDENIDTAGKSLTIQGAGIAATVIDGGGRNRVITSALTASDPGLVLQDLTIQHGRVTVGDGGGILAAGRLTITNVLVYSNTVTTPLGKGGGVNVPNGMLAMSGAQFIANSAAGKGGGVNAIGSVDITGTQFISNTAGGDGGGLQAQGIVNITGTQFIANSVANDGGGLVGVGTINVVRTQFMTNTAGGGFGGMYYAEYGLQLQMIDSQFISNTAVSDVGGGLGAAGTVIITNTQFIRNSTGVLGGGMYASKSTSIFGAQFTGNRAASGGGLFQNSPQPAHIVNSLFADNDAADGGALYLQNSGATANDLLFSTIAFATRGTGGPAIYVKGGALNITNTIVASYTTGIYNDGGAVSSDYNLFYHAPTSEITGSHSITGVNPLFVNARTGNYRLRIDSPAAGKGLDTGVTTDLDGITRPNPPSIGAYEAVQLIGLTLLKSATPATNVPYHGRVTYQLVLGNIGSITDAPVVLTDVLPSAVTFGQWLAGPPAGTLRSGNAITWTGALAGQSAITLTFSVTHTGTYSQAVTNRAWFSGTVQQGSAAATFITEQRPVCFATPNNGTSVFRSADSSAVQQAVDAAGVGATVKVAGVCAGVQTRGGSTQAVLVNKAVTIAGGYTTTNWTTAFPLTQPTTLDGLARGRVIAATAKLGLRDLTVQHGYNTTGNGGGIWALSGLTLANVQVYSNTVTGAGDGGGAYVTGGQLTVTDTEFISNTTAHDGGGLYGDDDVGITGTQFISNTAAHDGGGLYGTGQGYITSTQFISNTAANGGGVFGNGLMTVANTLWFGNAAGVRGGGMAFDQNGMLQLIDSQFYQNKSASAVGGGLAITSPVTITNTQFVNNRAGTDGGGLFAYQRVSITGSVFYGNRATTIISGSGGGIYAIGPITVTGTMFYRNGARRCGGGLCALNAVSASQTQFLNNFAYSFGGGMFGQSTINLTATQFYKNGAVFGGGLFQNASRAARIVNSTFTDNDASDGGAMYLQNSGATASSLLFATIAAATLLTETSAIYVESGALNISNTIVASYTTGIYSDGGVVSSDYNLFYNAPTTIPIGTHSITGTDPLFVDAFDNNYHVGPGTPAFGKGIAAGIAVDLAGIARPNPPTIGAYELQYLNVALSKSAAITREVVYRTPVTYTIAFSATGNTVAPVAILRDVLPIYTTFAGWVGTPPAGATQVGNTIGWTGAISNGTTVTLTFAVTNKAPGGAPVTNEVSLAAHLLSGSDIFTGTYADYDTTAKLIPSATSGLWSEVFPPCVSVCDYIIPPGYSVIQDIKVVLGGNLTVQGSLDPNNHAIELVGAKPQTLSGNPLTLAGLVINKNHRNDTVTVAGKLVVTEMLTIQKGKLVSASKYRDIEIDDEGELELTGDITVTGDITIAATGTFTPNLATVVLDGDREQVLNLAGPTTFFNLVVMTGTTLVELDPAPNLLVSNTLTNYGTIRKSQAVTGAGAYTFGLAGRYLPAGADVLVNIRTPGTLTALQVDRVDGNPANSPPDQTTGIYWVISPVGDGYTADLTLPYLHVPDPYACRYLTGRAWDCAVTSASPVTVTRAGVTAFSTWAVFAQSEATATDLAAAPNPALFGHSVYFTATVSSFNGIAPTGTVTFNDGATPIGVGVVVDGIAVYSNTTLVVGSHSVTAVYAGDAHHQASTSPEVVVVIQVPQELVLTLAKTVIPTDAVPFGSPVTYTIVFSTTGTGADPSVVVTDVLPAGTTFAAWVGDPPIGAVQAGNTVTWTGALSDGSVIALTFTATNIANSITTVTNTVWLQGTLVAGHAAAAYHASTPPAAFMHMIQIFQNYRMPTASAAEPAPETTLPPPAVTPVAPSPFEMPERVFLPAMRR